MISKTKKILQGLILASMAPLLVGCGGVGSLALGSLFGGAQGAALLGGSESPLVSGEAIAAIHNPEPASMLLLGSGMAAMAYFKAKAGK